MMQRSALLNSDRVHPLAYPTQDGHWGSLGGLVVGCHAGGLASILCSCASDIRWMETGRILQGLTVVLKASRQARVAHSRHSVLPVPVGLSSRALERCRADQRVKHAAAGGFGSALWQISLLPCRQI